MKNLKQAGFTLVELLVVIAIIGILAAAVLIAVNPLEQIRKTQDQSLLTTATTYLGAVQSYAATKGNLPWPSPCTTPASTPLSNATGTCITNAMVATGDLKQGSANQASVLSKLYLSESSYGNVVTPVICFQPQSSNMKNDTEKNRYTQAGANTCTPGSSACYVCVF